MTEEAQQYVLDQIKTLDLNPIDTGCGTHIYSERYEVEGKVYELYYTLGGGDVPDVEEYQEPISYTELMARVEKIKKEKETQTDYSI